MIFDWPVLAMFTLGLAVLFVTSKDGKTTPFGVYFAVMILIWGHDLSHHLNGH
jgi:hypothetical protein